MTYGPAGTYLTGRAPLQVTARLGNPLYYFITAELPGSGSVECEILIGTKVMARSVATGRHNLASCQISRDPLSGKWQDAGRRLTCRAAGPLAECLFSGYKSVMTAESGRGHAPSAEAGEDQSEGAEPGEAPAPAAARGGSSSPGTGTATRNGRSASSGASRACSRGRASGSSCISGTSASGRTRHGKAYLDRVSGALAEAEAELWFVDGNHEDFAQLGQAGREPGPGRARDGGPAGHAPAARLPVELARPAPGWPAGAR